MTKILVVEDNPTLLESIAFELEMHDYDALQAKDGQEAIDILAQTVSLPDLIISDIAMPNINGYDLLEQVRNHKEWQAIPFIFLTAFDSKNAIRIGKGLGVDDYLTKPFEPEDLIIAVENKLKRAKIFEAQAKQQLETMRRELTNLITHELRTPLTAIYGGTDLLTRSLEDISDAETKHYLQLIRSGTNRLNRLIERIVILVYIDSGHLDRMQELMRASHDLNTIVKDTVQSCIDRYQHQKLEFHINLSEEALFLQGVEGFIQAIVYEVIDNAAKFSETGGSISIETSQSDDNILLSIQDHGRGIPSEHLERVFERYIQIDRQQYEQQGMGIGLYLVRKLVEAFDEHVDLSSQVAKGTRLDIFFPIGEPTPKLK